MERQGDPPLLVPSLIFIALVSVASTIGIGVGYPLAGLLTQFGGVRAAYGLGVLVTALALLAAVLSIPVPSMAGHDHAARLDAPGAMLLAAGYGFGLSTFVAALVLVPFSVLGFVAGRITPRLQRRIGASRQLAAVILAVTPEGETSSAMSFNQVVRSVGFSIGSAVGGLVLSSSSTPAFPANGSYTAAAWIGAGITAITAIASAISTRGLPGLGEGWWVAVQRLPSGPVGRGCAVGVQDEPPAPPVDGDVMMELAQKRAVLHRGLAAVCLVNDVVHVAPGGGPLAAGPRAVLVAQDDGAADMSRDAVGPPDVKRQARRVPRMLKEPGPQDRGDPGRPGDQADGQGGGLLVRPVP